MTTKLFNHHRGSDKGLRRITASLILACSAALSGVVSAAPVVPSAEVSDGILRWVDGQQQGQPVALFGANYSVPFAYSYRALQKRGIDHKAAIDMDVAHMARLGLDAYRVHVWDRQISDKQGNLLNNQHLELFDYLLAKLAERQIRVIITPIAWWGSGYPEPDPDEPGFASDYSKADMNQQPAAIAAQQRYLQQFFAHVNPYTQHSYATDPNIVAIELFNEPRHPDSLDGNIDYINGLVKVVRQAGVSKPLFYNISEQGNNQQFAQNLCTSQIDGVAYQWYPAGLVKNSELASNLLPSVAHYSDPFAAIDACQSKARMIYEFDAADTAKSVMYPAMARSFKEAGFQWATQFAYDPAAIADTNSDYNTHYLNLLYTPSKALSLMIAAQVFRQVPVGQQQADYPQSNDFTTAQSQVSLDYANDSSVLNSASQFLYSNTTRVQPGNQKTLKQIAGVGSSALIDYQGSGAYFVDKLSQGNWRLEVYPDVLELQDPYQSASLKREVRRLYAAEQHMQIKLDELGERFSITPINAADAKAVKADKGRFAVRPGVYLLSRKSPDSAMLAKVSAEYYLPTLKPGELALVHQPQRELTLNDPLSFSVQVAAQQPIEQVSLWLRYRGNREFSELPMHYVGANRYTLTLPANDPQWQHAGQLEYGFVVNQPDQQMTFPGRAQGNPAEWDFVATQDYWQLAIRPKDAPLTLFDAAADRNTLVYPNGAHASWKYVSAEQGKGLALQLSVDKLNEQNPLVRLTLAADNQFSQRKLENYTTVAIKLRAVQQAEKLQFGLLDGNGLAHGIELDVSTGWQYLLVPLSALRPIDTLLPQSYPMFMPASVLAGKDAGSQWLEQLNQLQGMQFAFSPVSQASTGWHAVEIAEISLIQR